MSNRETKYMGYHNEYITESIIDMPNDHLDTCDVTCKLNVLFRDPLSFTMKNEGNSIRFTPTSTPTSGLLKYNSNPYSLVQLSIYNQSLNTTQGVSGDGEIQLEFSADTNSDPNKVSLSIPLIKRGSTTSSSTLLTNMIEAAKNTISSAGETALSEPYEVGNFIPSKPFYQYNTNSGSQTRIIYREEDGIGITDDTYTVLSGLITKHNLPVFHLNNMSKNETMPIFFNNTGSINTEGFINNIFKSIKEGFTHNFKEGLENSGKDDIYIECKPTGEEGEKTTLQPIKMDKISKTANTILEVLLKFVIAVIVMYGLWSVPKMFARKSPPGGSVKVPQPAIPKATA